MGKLIFPEIQFSVQLYMNSPERFLNVVGIQGKINNIKIKLFLCVVRLDNQNQQGSSCYEVPSHEIRNPYLVCPSCIESFGNSEPV